MPDDVPKHEFTQIQALLRNIPNHATWKKERDRLGGQSNAAPLFNVGKSLDKFWQRFDPANIDTAQQAIAELTKVLTGYAKAVKKSTPKVENYVTKQVVGSLEKLNELLTEGPREQHRKGKKLVLSIERALASLNLTVKDKVAKDENLSRSHLKSCEKGLEPIIAGVEKAKELTNEQGWLDLEDLEQHCHGVMEEVRKFQNYWLPIINEEPDFEDADEHWNLFVFPALVGELNVRLAKENTPVIAAINDPQKLIVGICGTALKRLNEVKFDPLRHSASKSTNGLYEELLKRGCDSIDEAIASVAQGEGANDTALLKYEPRVQKVPPRVPHESKVGILSTKTRSERPPEESYGELAQRVVKAKTHLQLAEILEKGHAGLFTHSGVVKKAFKHWMSFLQAGEVCLAIERINKKQAKEDDLAKVQNPWEQELLPLVAGFADPGSDEFKKVVKTKIEAIIAGLAAKTKPD